MTANIITVKNIVYLLYLTNNEYYLYFIIYLYFYNTLVRSINLVPIPNNR